MLQLGRDKDRNKTFIPEVDGKVLLSNNYVKHELMDWHVYWWVHTLKVGKGLQQKYALISRLR